MSTKEADRLAVLIDADNISSKHAEVIFAEIASLGEASIRRIYGDFSHGPPQGWDKETLARWAIVPHQQFANTTGKNASDIALVIDAMDILHSGRFDAFVLISSDSDFTRLASRIREQGLGVFGIGLQKTPEAFVAACKRFIYIENLEAEVSADEEQDGKSTKKKKQDLHKAYQLIRNVVLNTSDPEGWAGMGYVGSELGRRYPDFDSRSYGYKKLSDLVRATERFEESGNNGNFKIRYRDDLQLKPISRRSAP
ncbi:NYN domain-containing protein [Primorskyibacter sp. S87]|uniref:NYN domain-containing protein n=1 Tax=Primorskyibacter sp. S87 TaxID=3415126 RepID=UPI003C7E834F